MTDDQQRSSATTPAEYPAVKVSMQQAYDLTMKVSIVGTRDIPGVFRLGCQPRQGAERVEEDPLDLPAPTRHWLVDVNKTVLSWLAQDESHQRAFLADPVAALRSAGVSMEREHVKAISRMRESIGLSQTVVPGLQLRSISAAVGKGGVKVVETHAPDWQDAVKKKRDDDCGCADKGRT